MTRFLRAGRALGMALFFAFSATTAIADASSYAIIANFGLTPNDGAAPTGLVELDGQLWGTTQIGGSPDSFGTLFRLTQGGRQTVVTFRPDGPKEGFPGPLIAGPDSKLYGSNGTQLFSLDPITLAFSAIGLDGPLGLVGPLVSDGASKVYGIAQDANISQPDCGVIYVYDLVAARTSIAYTSPWGSGACPLGQIWNGTLRISNGVTYGSIRATTAAPGGAIFALRNDGSGYTVIHAFTGQGYSEPGPIVIAGDTIFGITSGFQGTVAPYQPPVPATVYEMHLDGSGYRVLHTFGIGQDWTTPNSLVRSGDNLFGTTGAQDANGAELVFELEGGANYRVMHRFLGSPDGAFPASLTVLKSGVIFGATTSGGTGMRCATIFPQEGCGTLFVLLPPASGHDAPRPAFVRGARR